MQSRNLEFSKGNKTSDLDYVIPFPNVVDNLRDPGLGVGKISRASFEENVRNLMNDSFVNNKPSSVLGEKGRMTFRIPNQLILLALKREL